LGYRFGDDASWRAKPIATGLKHRKNMGEETMKKPVVFAIGAHPDDIEFMMAGTLLCLSEAGCETHLMNVANGNCGSATENRADAATTRLGEAQDAAAALGAHFHPPICADIEIFHDLKLLQKLAAVVREVAPTILLIQSPEDYMEDHMIACRLAVSAAFTRGMQNFITDPTRDPISGEVCVYHALPYGLCDGLRRVIKPGQYVDVGDVLPAKRAALACHRSQKEWLDTSQGLDSYLNTMEDMARKVGAWSGKFAYAEGWRRHSHLGFCGENHDPLAEALGARCLRCERYEEKLREGI
jgi:N-acetylglucosamine malate deacetylase 1